MECVGLSRYYNLPDIFPMLERGCRLFTRSLRAGSRGYTFLIKNPSWAKDMEKDSLDFRLEK